MAGIHHLLLVKMRHYGMMCHHEDIAMSVSKCLGCTLTKKIKLTLRDAACRLMTAYVGLIGIESD